MIYTTQILIAFLLVLLVSSIGFKKYVWFISIGYGLSVFIIGLSNLFLYSNLDLGMIIASILLMIYGLRLSGYLAIRELKSTSYNKKMKTEISDGSHMTIPLKMMLWISCGLLYFMMTSPITYRLTNNVPTNTTLIIGIIVMLSGIIIEAVADMQKSKSKKINPNTFASTGLYKIVRCPNYLGELIMWTGVFISGFTALTGIGQWIIAIIGYIGIVYVMFSGARRLELRQDKNYGKDKKYQEYKKKTPIMIPLIPLYSVKKYKWLVG